MDSPPPINDCLSGQIQISTSVSHPKPSAQPVEIGITAVPFVLLVQLFMIQHDCGHGSFFCQRWANDWIGRAIGVLTFTPYDHWRRSRAVHHASREILTGAASVTSQRRPSPNTPRFGASASGLGTKARRAVGSAVGPGKDAARELQAIINSLRLQAEASLAGRCFVGHEAVGGLFLVGPTKSVR